MRNWTPNRVVCGGLHVWASEFWCQQKRSRTPAGLSLTSFVLPSSVGVQITALYQGKWGYYKTTIMDPEAFLEMANQVTKLKMYPYFDIAHCTLCCLYVRDDLGTGKYTLNGSLLFISLVRNSDVYYVKDLSFLLWGVHFVQWSIPVQLRLFLSVNH